MDSTQPNILYFDIETLPLMVFAWELGKQVIPYQNIYKERQVACIGYAWNNEPAQILGMDYKKHDLHVRDNDADRQMIEEFVNISSDADVVIGHNVKAFDIGVLRSRIIKFGLPDFVPFLVNDSYQSTKGIGFTSHKLDYMATYFEMEQKAEHPYQMWVDVMTHRAGAFSKMQVYCMGDVDITRNVYLKLKPYIKSSLNMAVFRNDNTVCPNCGEAGMLIRRGYRYTLTGKYPRFECKACHTYPHIGKSTLLKGSTFPR